MFHNLSGYDSHLFVKCLGDDFNISQSSLHILLEQVPYRSDGLSLLAALNKFKEIVSDLFGDVPVLSILFILFTGKGMPDVASRLMLAKIFSEISNANPGGIIILNGYSRGAPGMCHGNGELTVDNIEWFGLTLLHMVKHNIFNREPSLKNLGYPSTLRDVCYGGK